VIDILFSFGSDIILVKIEGNKVMFGNTMNGAQMADIKGLKLSYEGTCKEFSDLIGNDNWREIAVSRFKNKIRSFKTSMEKANYIIEDLKEHGYIAKQIQRRGFRPESLNG